MIRVSSGPSRLVWLTFVLVALSLSCSDEMSAARAGDSPRDARKPSSSAAKSAPSNVVLILADDLGYGALGCYGQMKVPTPNIDRLAKEGMRFTQCYAGSHVCQPSRCVLMTGRHTGHTPVRANDVAQHLRDEDVTVAEICKAAGHSTGAFGKWGLGYEGTAGHPNRQGFDQYFGQLLQVHAHFYYPFWLWKDEEKFSLPGNENGQKKQYVTDVIHARGVEFLRAQKKDKPFFVYLPYIIPHVELTVPEDSEAPFRGKFPVRPILDTRPKYLGSEDGFATYAGMISRLDGYVGEVLATLKAQGVENDTLVIFTSDNGGQNGGKDGGWTAMTDFFQNNGSLRGYKGQWYEGGIRVPFLARWPVGIAAGRTSEAVVGFQDVLPTVAELLGVPAPEKLDGRSLAPLLRGQGDTLDRDGMYWEYPVKNGNSRAARMENWKAIQTVPAGPVELYDLATDPSEKTNVAADNVEVVKRLVEFMDRSHAEPPAFTRKPVPQTVETFVR